MRENNIEEWIGTHDDQNIPARVKIRIFKKHNGTCAICTNRVITAAFDHIVALCNGEGGHRENNLQLLCVPCHKGKTTADVAEKSKVARKFAKNIGLRPSSRGKLASRGFEKAKPQRTASRPLERRS